MTDRRFVCVVDGAPETTRRLVREACASRGVLYEEVEVSTFDFSTAQPLPPGTLLYRPSLSNASMRVEQALFGPGVATFYREPDGIFREIGPDIVIYERAGVPVPRFLWGNTTDRAVLRRYVEALGGFPLILKFRGGSGGIGVLRIDSFAGLFSTMDHALGGSGRMPILMRYVPDATHWRILVVGGKRAGSYRNRREEDDFRTYPTDDPEDYRILPSAAVVESAVRATASIEVDFGGVDVLEDAEGRPWVLEVNFPCYFGRAKLVGGQDVGGAMIDWLVAKAERLSAV